MLTQDEADARARAVWGVDVTVSPWLKDTWLVQLPAGVPHRLDEQGRVACGHPDCRLRERDVDAVDAVQLRHVLRTRMGMPSRVEVWRGPYVIGQIVAAGPRSVSVQPDAGGAVEVTPDGAGVVLRFVPPPP